MRTFLVSVACIAALFAEPVFAQESSPVLKWDFEAGFGRTSGGGTRRDVPQAFGFGALVATPLRSGVNSDLVVGAGLSAHWPLDYGTSCIVIPDTSGCVPVYPMFRTYAALVGKEFGNRRGVGGTRALVGPALFRTDEKQTLFGIQGRVDVSVVQVSRAGLTMWTQLSTASPFRSERYVLWTMGVGARLR